MNEEILRNYQILVGQYQANFDAKKKLIKLISLGRLISFVGIIPSYYYLKPVSGILAVIISSLFLISFFFLIKKFIQAEQQLLFFKRLVEINVNEIKALNRDFSPFDPGDEFTDTHHDYSYDLDLYGNNSLFQFLNRTVTRRGKEQLSKLLNQSEENTEEIKTRQSAIQELAENLNWRQQFQAVGKETEDQKNHTLIDETIGQKIQLNSAQTITYLIKIIPLITLLLIGLNVSGIYPNSIYLIAIFMQWFFFIIYSKTIARFNKQFESQAKRLNLYSKMLHRIETNPFQSSYLNSLKEKLITKGKPASIITSELQKILNEFDYRQNILVGFLLNSIFLWDLRCLSKLYRWQQNFEGDLPKWFEVIAEMDALVSLANCNFNHPEWTTPEVINTAFQLNAIDLGHPLIDASKCIRNSFQIINQQQIALITGANMAGKSTFLRTVGVNLILAGNGCKVCADKFKFSPIRIFTNMRTSDNLMNDESYFYAELLRLQTLLNSLRNGENLFVIIDEMLKGTNSTDKLNGSKELINQLISLKTHGIVATHDLGLTELIKKYPNSIKNQCFEVLLQDDELKFDYKLTDGVTQTMNATFLMKKMGIIPN